MSTSEHARLRSVTDDIGGWRRWGPYLSERSWATVREDYSPDGEAWSFLTHDMARSKAYRWGEDGIAGICDRFQILCFAPAFWNGRDPFLKERLFGLTPLEGNHGEDVKEYYFHLDNTPTHAYMMYLYKYPQRAFPYAWLVEENQRRRGQGLEFELLDTGIFDDDRYFDIFIEYAKVDEEDLCIRIEAHNRGPEPAALHILPHLWFRNTWSWGPTPTPRPVIRQGPDGRGFCSLLSDDAALEPLPKLPLDYRLGQRVLYGPPAESLFTGNETNCDRLYGVPNRTPFVKDAFHRYLVGQDSVPDQSAGQEQNPNLRSGTKAALHHYFPSVPPGASVVVRLRLSPETNLSDPLGVVDGVIAERRAEADEFYDAIHPHGASAEERRLQRQALAGLLWTKQSYLFDVEIWQKGDNPTAPPPASRLHIRNQHWPHLNSMRVMTVPDKWEYPWFAAWDLAFHCVALVLVDPQYAKDQLWVLLFEQFQHANGQIPAYEWEFSDLNPPVHAWAVWRVYHLDRLRNGVAHRDFLEKCFHKLLINFAWWVNKVDHEGNNIFEGGFLGLDNITVVNRSERLRDGAVLEQADATGWIAMFCLNMMRIALELAQENPVYEGLATKFFQHYAYVAHAMKHMGNRPYQLWDERDGFFYDVLRYPDGAFQKFRVRSAVGLIPLFAVERLEQRWLERFPNFGRNVRWFLKNRPDLVYDVIHKTEQDGQTVHVLTVVNHDQLVRLLTRLWDTDEFLSPFGLRSLSKYHEKYPFLFGGRSVGYEPAEAITKIKGGNSNWRGPIWFPTNFLLIETLRQLGKAFGETFTFSPRPKEKESGVRGTSDASPRLLGEGSGVRGLTFSQMAKDIADRLIRLFLPDERGQRPIYCAERKFQDDPHWKDYLLFHEYFHGDTGAGLGASHQTGWTALVASLIDTWR
ncbi:MAG: glucosidase [Gemmataceae bacterium]|nr:glucosidase [Gemmataceae bacterium]